MDERGTTAFFKKKKNVKRKIKNRYFSWLSQILTLVSLIHGKDTFSEKSLKESLAPKHLKIISRQWKELEFSCYLPCICVGF